MTKSDKIATEFCYGLFFLKDIKTLKKQKISEHQGKFKEMLYF